MKRVILFGIRAYRALRIGPPTCRFEPSCSQYAQEAVEAHGAPKGALLALRRLLRCRPGAAWGSDPVPDATGAHRQWTSERRPRCF